MAEIDIKTVSAGVAELNAKLKEMQDATSPEKTNAVVTELVSKLFTEWEGKTSPGRNSGDGAENFNINKVFAGLDTSNSKAVHDAFLNARVSPTDKDFERGRINKFQELNDQLVILSAITKIHPRELGLFKQYQEVSKYMYSGSAGSGAEWIPTLFSNRMVDKVRLALMVADLFEMFDMPSNPYTWPIQTTDVVAYKAGEPTSGDIFETATGATFPESSSGTSNITFTAVKVAAKTKFSDELSEDSIIPVLGNVENAIALAIRQAIESCIINGDTTGTHQDSDVTFSYDRRKMWMGLRKMTQSGAKYNMSTFSLAGIRVLRQLMGVFGVDPSQLVFLTSMSVYHKLLNLDQVTTVDKYGPNATVLRGELGKLDNIPIVISEFCRADLNATGVYDGSTTDKSILQLIRKDQFKIGNRREFRLESDRDITTGVNILVASQRLHFRDVAPYATNKIAAMGYNIATGTT